MSERMREDILLVFKHHRTTLLKARIRWSRLQRIVHPQVRLQFLRT